jgi:WD40 repeat protein
VRGRGARPSPARVPRTFCGDRSRGLLARRSGGPLISADGTIRRFSTEDGAELAPPLARTGRALVSLAWSERADRVIGVDEGGSARLWRLSDGETIADYETASGAVAFAPDGERFAIALAARSVSIRASTDGSELRIVPAVARAEGEDPPAPIIARDLAFQPGSGVLAIANEGKGIEFVHPTSDALDPRGVRLFPPRRLEYDSTGRHLLVSGDNWGSVRMIDLETGTVPQINVLHEGAITTTTFDASGDLWLSAARDGSVFVWETSSCRPIVERPCGHGRVLCATFSHAPGPTRVIAGCEDGCAVVFPIDPLPAARARVPRKLDRWELDNEERLEEQLAEPSRAR